MGSVVNGSTSSAGMGSSTGVKQTDAVKARTLLTALRNDQVAAGLRSGEHDFMYGQQIGSNGKLTMLRVEQSMIFVMQHDGKTLPDGVDINKLSGQFDSSASKLVAAFTQAYPNYKNSDGYLAPGSDQNGANQIGIQTLGNLESQLQRISGEI